MSASHPTGGRLLSDVVASEWTKLRSVRSTYWSTLAAVVVGVGLSAAISAANASAYHQLSATDRAAFDPTSISLAGLFFSQLALGVVGVLAISAEYTTGMIRTTLAAVPQRGYVLAAKGIVICLVALAVGMVTSFAAFWIGQLILATKHLDTSLGDPGVLRAVIGGGLYLGVLVLFALGLATIIRHSAGAITALVALVFVLPAVSGALPQSWQHNFARYLPASAGGAITSVTHTSTSLSPWLGFVVFCGWAALALGVGWSLLRRRDV